MNLVIFLGVFGSTGLLAAAGNYPDKIQTRLQALIRHDSTEQLRSALEKYNQALKDPAALAKAAQDVGLSTKDIQEISAHYSNETGGTQPLAKWTDEEIILEGSGNRVMVNAKDLWRQGIRVNGKIFQWNWRQPVAVNLRNYNALFLSDKTTFRVPDLITSAWADNLFQIKVAGLRLYFLVSSVGEIGGELYRLNTNIKEMTALCEAPEPAPGSDDPFLRSVIKVRGFSKIFGRSFTLHNCGDLKAFSKLQWNLQGEPVFPHPIRSLRKFDRLAACITIRWTRLLSQLRPESGPKIKTNGMNQRKQQKALG